ncbi:MAG: hypothetical protein ABSB97_05470 [Thermoplasmata archaeon]|jgi:hypothetical protein
MGLYWVRHVTCPKCGGQFDYRFVPGASVTALRLGNSRYMRCQLCHRFGVFRLTGPGTAVPRGPSAGSETSDESAPLPSGKGCF